MNTDKHGHGIGVMEYWSAEVPTVQYSTTPTLQYSLLSP
jgi:hypothetical protein